MDLLQFSLSVISTGRLVELKGFKGSINTDRSAVFDPETSA